MSIQAAINAAKSGDVIEVAAGVYQEDIVVDKAVHIKGPNAEIAGNGARGAEAVVHPATSAVSMGEIFHVEASDVTIEGFVIDGDNQHPGLINSCNIFECDFPPRVRHETCLAFCKG